MSMPFAMDNAALKLLALSTFDDKPIQIKPRWPAQQILIDELAWQKLLAVQAGLPPHLSLILTRAYEPRASGLGRARTQFRRAGIWLFGFLYRHRKAEIPDIFGSNGHDLDGTHIDVSFCIHRQRVRLLPLSVFTPLSWQKKRMDKYREALALVQAALVSQGFCLHGNQTESLQIHCDLKPVLQ